MAAVAGLAAMVRVWLQWRSGPGWPAGGEAAGLGRLGEGRPCWADWGEGGQVRGEGCRG